MIHARKRFSLAALLMLAMFSFGRANPGAWGDAAPTGTGIGTLIDRQRGKAAETNIQDGGIRAKIINSYVGEWSEEFQFNGPPMSVSGTGKWSFVKKDDNTIEGYQDSLEIGAGMFGRRFSRPSLFLRGTFAGPDSTELHWLTFPLTGNQEGQPLPGNPTACSLADGWPISLEVSPDGHQISFGYTFADLQSCYPNQKLGPSQVRFILRSQTNVVLNPGVTTQTGPSGTITSSTQTSVLNQASMTEPHGFYDPRHLNFDTLDGIVVNPSGGTFSLYGHRSSSTSFLRVPYLDYLAAALQSESPTFSLEWTPESEIDVDRALSISEGSLEERMAKIWDSNHKLNSLGAWFFSAAGAKGVMAGQNAFEVFSNVFHSLGDTAKAFPIGFLGQMHSRYESQGQQYLNGPRFANDLQGILDTTIPADTRNELTRRFKSGQISEQQLQVQGETAMLQGFASVYGLDPSPIIQAFNANLYRGTDEALFSGFSALYADTKIIGKEAISRLLAGKTLYAPPEIMSQLLGGTPRVHPVFTGMPAGSLLAQTAAYGDVFCKNLMSMPEVKSDIPQYRTYFEWRQTINQTPATEGHTWITPDGFEMNESSDGYSLGFGRTPMRFHIDKFHANHEEVEDPLLHQYADELTSLYDSMAAKFPILHKLRESMKVMAIAKWLKNRGYHLQLPDDGRGSWAPPEEIPGVLHGAFAVTDPREGEVGTILSAEGGIDYRVDKWWVFHKSPDRIISTDDPNEQSVKVSWDPQSGQVSMPPVVSSEIDGLKNCHDVPSFFGTRKVVCEEDTTPVANSQPPKEVASPPSPGGAVAINGNTPQLLRNSSTSGGKSIVGTSPQDGVPACSQTLANLRKEASIIQSALTGLNKSMEHNEAVREESEKIIDNAVDEGKDKLLSAFIDLTGNVLDDRLEEATEETQRAILKRMQDKITPDQRNQYDAAFKILSGQKKDIMRIVERFQTLERANNVREINNSLSKQALAGSERLEKFYDVWTKFMSDPLVRKAIKFSEPAAKALKVVDALRGDLDAGYLLGSEYLSWQNIKRLDRNTDQYLKAVKDLSAKLKAVMGKVKSVERQMKDSKVSGCS